MVTQEKKTCTFTTAVEKLVYPRWETSRWWSQVLEKSSQWSKFTFSVYLDLEVMILMFLFHHLKLITIVLQGVDPTIRAEVWPFLLGV